MSTISIEQALQIAVEHHQAGQFAQAEALYRQILAVQPQHPDALHLLGVIALQFGQHEAATDLISRAIREKPNDATFHSNLGEAFRALGRLDEAIACYRQSLELKPENSDAHNNLGIALDSIGQSDAAVASYRRALEIMPYLVQAHSNLGGVLQRQGQWDEAVACYRRALEIKPDYAEAHYNLGLAWFHKGQTDQAVECYRRALEIRPEYPEAHNNLGTALSSLGKLDEAVACFGRALEIKPDNAEAHYNLGLAWFSKGQIAEALASDRRAAALAPHEPAFLSNLLYTLHADPTCDAAALLQEHREWDTRHGLPRRQFFRPHPNRPDPQRRLKVGYVSPDLRNHPVGRFLLPLLENHDHAAFEILCYADAARPDIVTDRLRACADRWHDTAGWTEERLTEQIRQEQVDLLIDLSLHTVGNRLPVFARKPAPVQVTWLSLPGTSGLTAMDYRLTDRYLDPPGTDHHSSEVSIRLPDCYWCYIATDASPEVSALPALDTGGVTFGCLNNFGKVNERVLAVWTRLLGAVPSSHLVLHAREGSHRERVRDLLHQEGIRPERVQFADYIPATDYYAQYGRIDIALDTFPYAGGTTTCDALWMGVPVVSLVGQTAVGRGGLSILSNIGLPELAARSEEEYLRIAMDLASDLPRLTQLRATLRQRMQASPLMDGPRFAHSMESAYRMMWHKWCEGRCEGSPSGRWILQTDLL